MGGFVGQQLTTKGISLLAKVLAGQCQLTFTKMKIGDGEIGVTDPLSLTDLKNVIKTLDITSVQYSEGKAIPKTTFNNSTITEDFYLRELGTFATDPQLGEILFAYDYVITGPEFIPKGGGSVLIEREIELEINIGNAENVSAIIDHSLVFASKKELSDLKNMTPVWGGTTTNVGNVYSISESTIEALVEGMAVSFKVNADSTGAVSLNWDGKGAKAVVKQNQAAVTNWKQDGIYTVRYGGANFQLQGEGGEYGTAGPAETLSGYTVGTESGVVNGTLALTGDSSVGDVLSGKTFYNTNAKSKQTGTMANYNNANLVHPATAVDSLVGGASDAVLKIKSGYDGKISTASTFQVVLNNLIAANVKSGVKIGDAADSSGDDYITGTFTSDATASAGQILSGATAYNNGVKVTGNIPSKGAATITPGTANQTIAAGQFLSGIQTILGEPNLLDVNIPVGMTMFNVVGANTNRKWASGYSDADVAGGQTATISNIGFTPSIILLRMGSSGAYAAAYCSNIGGLALSPARWFEDSSGWSSSPPSSSSAIITTVGNGTFTFLVPSTFTVTGRWYWVAIA